MNRTQVKLDELKANGFEIANDNRSVVTTTQKATDYKNKYYSDSEYILGSVLSGTEQLSNIEYDICFQVIEDNYTILENELYGDLHEKAKENDCIEFMNFIHNLNRYDLSKEVRIDLIEEVAEALQDIIDEINQIINDIK